MHFLFLHLQPDSLLHFLLPLIPPHVGLDEGVVGEWLGLTEEGLGVGLGGRVTRVGRFVGFRIERK